MYVMEKTLLNQKELANKLGLGRYSIEDLIEKKLKPSIVNIGKKKLYDHSVVISLLFETKSSPDKNLFLNKKQLCKKLGVGRYALETLIKTKLNDAVVKIGNHNFFNYKIVTRLLFNNAKIKPNIGKEILKEFNKITNRKYKSLKATKLIMSLIVKGYTKDDILLVAEHKIFESSKYDGFPNDDNPIGFPKKYITPRTLYEPEKFECYLKSAKGALNE